MNPRFHAPLRVAAVGAASAVIGVLAATPAGAAGDGSAPGVKVVNTETVQVYTSPVGEVRTRRVYEQLALTGHGSVDLSNPVSTHNLRNLDGFGGFDVAHGEQITKTTVDGDKRLRSVSDYDGRLPLDVSVAYKLNGKHVDPGDVVGKDGRLEVTYTVQNVTAKPQQVSFGDGHGGTVTKTVQVPIPMVGSLTTTAPPNFTNVRSASANMGGDGKGGTQLSFTMTLFPPIGSDTAVFGYTADIKDGLVPRAEVSALPVDPMQSPTFKSAAGSYQGGADTGAQLADGAGQIDSNLLKLRDGAGQLLAGLIKLRDGAGQLQTGLAEKAVPGSHDLADGAHQLDTGLGRINSGSKKLAAGTGEAFAGSKELERGAARLAAGQRDLLDGVKLLKSGVENLPTTVGDQLRGNDDYNKLLGAMDAIVAGIGDDTQVANPATGQPATLYAGLNATKYGLKSPFGYSQAECLKAAAGDLTAHCGVVDALKTVSDGLSGAASGIDAKAGDLQALFGGAVSIYNFVATTTSACTPVAPGTLPPPAALTSPHPACVGAAQVAYGIGGPGGVIDQSTSGSTNIKMAAGALDGVAANVNTRMLPGIDRLKAGLHNPGALADCAAASETATPADDCGIRDAVAYFRATAIPTLVSQLTNSIASELLANIAVPAGGCAPHNPTLLCGAGALADGGGELAGGSSELAAGLGRLDAGAGKLAGGAGDAADGSGRLAAGADQLSSGLEDAADGSGRLADGLTKAAGGGPKLVHGAQRLSDEGTKQLVKAGEDTAQSYGELYATMAAGAQRARSEGMAFGAPKGAVGLTAYNYVITGDDGENGRNWTRGVGGLAILGAGAGAFALRRRLV